MQKQNIGCNIQGYLCLSFKAEVRRKLNASITSKGGSATSEKNYSPPQEEDCSLLPPTV